MCQHVGYTEASPGTMPSAADVELGTAPALFRFGATPVDPNRSAKGRGPLPLPPRAHLDHVLLESLEDFIESPPATVTWWLTADEDGCVVLTDKVTKDWVPSPVQGRWGGVAARLDLDYTSSIQGQELFLWVFADTFTDVVVRPRLVWHTLAAADLTPTHRCRLGLT